jgi:DNA-directed RNA polymerase specialized sigma24 family protein
MLELIHSRRVPLSTLQPQRPIDELATVAEAARQGDPQATRTLVHAVGPHILRTIRAVLGRDHPALDDVAQGGLSRLSSLAAFP